MRAVQNILADNLAADAIDEALFDRYLYTAGLGDMDLVIRTGGDERLSNFFPWQAAHGYFYSTKTYWPDFDESELARALDAYNRFFLAREKWAQT